MIKRGGLETTAQTDPAWGRPIRISTTVRKAYRKIYGNSELESMRNSELNEYIAEDFINSAGRIIHYFKLGSEEVPKEEREWAEIRNMVKSGKGLFQFYVSAIRPESIDVLVLQGKYLKTKFKKTPQGI